MSSTLANKPQMISALMELIYVYIYRAVVLRLGSKTSTSVSPGNLLEMQVLGRPQHIKVIPHPPMVITTMTPGKDVGT